MGLIDVLRRIDEEIMPRTCAFCGVACVPGEVAICRGCDGDLPRNACDESMPPFSAVVAPMRYEYPVDAAIKALKFRRRLDYLPAFSELLEEALPALPPGIDALLPVPLHWFRHATRGFNQSAELARSLQHATGLPVLQTVSRVRATRYQSGLHADERRKNLRRAFRVRRRTGSRHPLIVDDVITTGTTAKALASVLLEAGADEVSVLAVART